MLSRKFRFHGLGSLNPVYRRGQTVRGPLMSLRYAPNNRQAHWRAAVVVSKKVHKSAVVRNRIRRRVYELIRHEVPADLAPHDMVLTIFSDTVAELPAGQLQQAIRSLLHRARLS